ncbi:MAG: DUF721 domain-containing protein [Alphaproteobacteria bacterium]|nr:DUF721 domain-containing protein [Alphaproteobacteria bacterium]MBL6775895.1 DUF721 domain-containing protein [Alphaproteobacteria bacterium]
MENSKPHRRKGRRLRKLSGLTEGLIAPAMRKRGQVLTKIIAGWPNIAGDAHQWCLPADINFPANSRIHATLTLSVASGRGPQIQMMSQEICKRVNSFCGFAAVSRLKIRQDLRSPRSLPAAHQAAPALDINGKTDKLALARLEKATANIKNPELRAALIRLGQTIG